MVKYSLIPTFSKWELRLLSPEPGNKKRFSVCSTSDTLFVCARLIISGE